MFWIKCVILWFGLRAAATQPCDSSSDEDQCSNGEICRNNRCEKAVSCSRHDECTGGTLCVSDYCQPHRCTSLGQCVHGQVCAQDRDVYGGTCVYQFVINVTEGSEVKLEFREPGTPGGYRQIQWYKGGRGGLNRTAVFHPLISGDTPLYYKGLCPGNKTSCRTSDRAHLNTDTGTLTIYSVDRRDSGYYYYSVLAVDGSPDTGDKYQYKLNFYVHFRDDIIIHGSLVYLLLTAASMIGVVLWIFVECIKYLVKLWKWTRRVNYKREF